MDCECIWWKCNEYIFKQMLHILIGANICTHITSWLGQVIEIFMWINKLTMFCAGHRQCQWELRDRLIWCSLCAHQGKLERYFGSSALVLDWTYSWCLVLCLQTLLFTLETDRWKFGFVFSPNFLSFSTREFNSVAELKYRNPRGNLFTGFSGLFRHQNQFGNILLDWRQSEIL